jgi:hypothetical protein
MSRPRPLLAGATLASALFLAACGSPGEGAATPQPDPASASTNGRADTGTVAVADGPATISTTTTSTIAPAPTTVDPATALATRLEASPLPSTPEALITELNEVETALGDTALDAALIPAWGRRQQLLYRVLSAHPDWAEPVVAGVEESVREVVSLNWLARSSLSALVRSESIAATLPAWEVSPPEPAATLLGFYREAADATGVPWEVLAAINLVETRMGRINGLSTAGAVGPMQFLPTTWAGCCTGDPTDDHDAIVGAAQYLVDRGAPENMDRAIFGYNNSDRYVAAVQAYAQVLRLAPQRYHGYHAWEVVFLSSAGLVRLPDGYRQTEPVDAATWLGDHPDALVTGAT